MIKHIVCFKLVDGSDETKQKTKDILMSMKVKVPTALEIEVGVDFLQSARSYDIVLQVVLENREALEIYQNDEYHCAVVKEYMHKVMSSSIAVDYDL